MLARGFVDACGKDHTGKLLFVASLEGEATINGSSEVRVLSPNKRLRIPVLSSVRLPGIWLLRIRIGDRLVRISWYCSIARLTGDRLHIGIRLTNHRA
jgi:hypothetical protein